MLKTTTKKTNTVSVRPPVVCVMGHIDHGKSTLLDYIRKTNLAEKEIGGITQHIAAYEVLHKSKEGEERKITFLDTPGHEAFQAMRSRGTTAADIAILVVSAEDGVKLQTLEALKSILESEIPYIVAITKIDKPSANIEKTRQSLAENEIYVEGYGGSIPVVSVSSKTGEGIDDLLDMIFLVAEMEELKGNPSKKAEGAVIESNLEKTKGISATLIIKDGKLQKGMYLAAGGAISPVRFIENYIGEQIPEAYFGSPVKIVGWNEIPKMGSPWKAFNTKKEAEEEARKSREDEKRKTEKSLPDKKEKEERIIIPIIVKTDVSGTLEAIEHEISKIGSEKVLIKIISKGVGTIGEGDIKLASGDPDTLVIGFNVKVDPRVRNMIEQGGVRMEIFDIIYKLRERLEEEAKKKTPREKTEETRGKAKILKIFSKNKEKQIVGGRVLEGAIELGAEVKILRREAEIGRGKIRELEQQKVKASEAGKDTEFGAMIQSPVLISAGDRIEAYVITER